MADKKQKDAQAELDALEDFGIEDIDDEDDEDTAPVAAAPVAAAPKPKADKPERVRYDRKNTAGKVISVLREDYLDGRKPSYRTQFTWPSLMDGMTVEQWHKATQALSESKTGAKGEGVPNIFLTELVANGFIAFEDAPAA